MNKQAMDPAKLLNLGLDGVSIYGRKSTSTYLFDKLSKILMKNEAKKTDGLMAESLDKESSFEGASLGALGGGLLGLGVSHLHSKTKQDGDQTSRKRKMLYSLLGAMLGGGIGHDYLLNKKSNEENSMNKVAYLEGYLMKQYLGMNKKAGWWDSISDTIGDAVSGVGNTIGDAADAVGDAIGDASGDDALTPTKEIPLSEQLRAKIDASPQYDYEEGKARLAKLMANIPTERSIYQQKNRDSNYTPEQQKATNDSVNAFNEEFGVTQPTASDSQSDKDYWAAKGIKY